MSGELRQRSTLRVCRGVSVTDGCLDLGQNLTRSPLLQRTGLVWRTTTQLLDLRLDVLQRPVRPQCTHLAWFSALIEPLAQLSDVLRCPVNATTKVQNLQTRERSSEEIKKLLEQSSTSSSSSSLVGLELRSATTRLGYSTRCANLSLRNTYIRHGHHHHHCKVEHWRHVSKEVFFDLLHVSYSQTTNCIEERRVSEDCGTSVGMAGRLFE